MRMRGFLAACAFLLVWIAFPSGATAQTTLAVSKSNAEIKFPTAIDFSLTATSNANISDIRLRYSVAEESYADVTSEVIVPFTQARTVNAQWAMDMRKTGGYPPGTALTYWWVVKDLSGAKIETQPSNISFDDSRYKWQKTSKGLVDLYWYSGGSAFSNEVMSAAQDALIRLQSSTGAELKRRVKLYVYASSQDLQGALIFPYEWTGGITLAPYGTIAIGISSSNLIWGKNATAHELCHLVIHQVTSNPYNDLPRWLDEGLAVYNEQTVDVSFSSALKRAVDSNDLVSVRSLSSPFSANAQVATLSYAESYSVVDFLISAYGQEEMLQLLDVFSKGSTYDGALKEVYGFDSEGLNTLWQKHVKQQFGGTIKPAVGRIAVTAS